MINSICTYFHVAKVVILLQLCNNKLSFFVEFLIFVFKEICFSTNFCKKIPKIFAYVKKKQYLCARK